MTGSLLLRNADHVVAMDDQRTVWRNAGIYAVDGAITIVGPSAELPTEADTVIDARGMIVVPGLINTHHHLFQALTRAWPPAQNAALTEWLRIHFRVWKHVTAEGLYWCSRQVLSELVLSGCTTTFDQNSYFPNDTTFDVEIQAAREVGIRFVGGRGAQTYDPTNTNAPPPEVCESEDGITEDIVRLVDRYHDRNPLAMCQLAVAPAHFGRIGKHFAKSLIALARELGIRGHTHLGETADEVTNFVKRHGLSLMDYAQQIGWVGADIWYAHGVHLSASELVNVGAHGGGIAHCPTSNARTGAGIADLSQMSQAGIQIGLGVDGSASNDSSNMMAEARMALLLQRARYGAGALTTDAALAFATRGGAALLGRDELGSIEPGKAADFVGIRSDRAELAGTSADPVAGLVLCQVPWVDMSVIDGQLRVWDGSILGLDFEETTRRHNRCASDLLTHAAN